MTNMELNQKEVWLLRDLLKDYEYGSNKSSSLTEQELAKLYDKLEDLRHLLKDERRRCLMVLC